MSDLKTNGPRDADDNRSENGNDPALQVTAARAMPSALAQTDASGQVTAARGDAFVADAVVVEPIGAAERPGFRSRETLDREMRDIKDEVLRMGSLVAAQIGLAIDALVSHDAQLATSAIVGD